MLKSDYANELMLARMEIHRLRVENNKLRIKAAYRLFLFPCGIVAASLMTVVVDIITNIL